MEECYGEDEQCWGFCWGRKLVAGKFVGKVIEKESIYGARSPSGELRLRVRGPKQWGASRIVEDQMRNTLKTEHPPRSDGLRVSIENGEPESFSEALSSKESLQWKKAIIEEMVSLENT
ncbi:hypothetical protein Tco_1251277 [Tanacetum coccineum]